MAEQKSTTTKAKPGDTKDRKPAVQGLRTFAADLKRAQKNSGDKTSTSKKPPVPPPNKATKQKPTPTEAKKAIDTTSGEQNAPAKNLTSENAPHKKKKAPNPDTKKKQKHNFRAEEPTAKSHTSPGQGLAPKRKASILGDDEEKIFDSSHTDIGAGTIITDTKRNRWTLRRALKEAMGDWAEDASNSVKDMVTDTTPKPTVAASDTRTEVVVAAGTDSELAPRNDHKVVLERLRTLERDATKRTGKPFTIKKKPVVEKSTGWTHVIDEEKSAPQKKEKSKKPTPSITTQKMVVAPPDIAHTTVTIDEAVATPTPRIIIPPEPEPEPKQEPVKPKTQTQTALITPLPDVPRIETQLDEPKTTQRSAPTVLTDRSVRPAKTPQNRIQNVTLTPRTDSARGAVPVPEIKVPAPTPEPVPVPVPKAPKSIPTPPPPTPIKTPEPTPVLQPKNERPQIHQGLTAPSRPSVVEQLNQDRGLSQPARPSLLKPILFIAGVVFGVALLTGTVLYILNQQAGGVTTVTAVSSLIATDQQIAVPLSSSRTELLQSLRNARSNAPAGITQLYFEDTVSESLAAAPSEADVLATLAWRTPGAFTRSIESLNFGTMRTEVEAPFIIMRVNSFDTALSGMITWEPFILDDLDPFVDNFGVNDTIIVDDTVVANRDTRVLSDSAGRERLLYTFMDTQTVLITTNRTALTNIIERYQRK